MDQDGKESSSNSDANQSEGIFSTPELTVDTEKLAQNTNSSNANTRSRVASIFANTDAGQRSQKLDDAMGMNNVQPAQVTEDVVIDNGPRKKSKLPIVIAIIAFVAVIGGFTAWVAMRNTTPNDTVSEHATLQEAKDKFIPYATYLLFGKEESSLTGTYSPARFYTLDEKFSNDEQSNAYWDTLLSLLNTSIESLKSVEKSDEYLVNYLETHQQNMFFLDTYRKADTLEDDYLIRFFTNYGADKTISLVQEQLSIFNNLDRRSSAESYYDAMIEQYTAYIAALGEYASAGCLTESGINDECVIGIEPTLSDTIRTFLITSADAKLAAQSIIDDTIKSVESDCWRISAQFDDVINQLANNDEENHDN